MLQLPSTSKIADSKRLYICLSITASKKQGRSNDWLLSKLCLASKVKAESAELMTYSEIQAKCQDLHFPWSSKLYNITCKLAGTDQVKTTLFIFPTVDF